MNPHIPHQKKEQTECVPQLSITDLKVKWPLLFYPCSACYTTRSACYTTCSACYATCSACYTTCSACYTTCSACYTTCSACYTTCSACYTTCSACYTTCSACYTTCSACYTTLQTKNSRGSVSVINPVTMEIQTIQSLIYTCREVIELLRIDTFGCQQKEMGHKGGHDVCIVYTKKHLLG